MWLTYIVSVCLEQIDLECLLYWKFSIRADQTYVTMLLYSSSFRAAITFKSIYNKWLVNGKWLFLLNIHYNLNINKVNSTYYEIELRQIKTKTILPQFQLSNKIFWTIMQWVYTRCLQVRILSTYIFRRFSENFSIPGTRISLFLGRNIYFRYFPFPLNKDLFYCTLVCTCSYLKSLIYMNEFVLVCEIRLMKYK